MDLAGSGLRAAETGPARGGMTRVLTRLELPVMAMSAHSMQGEFRAKNPGTTAV
jgi:hypothetical protein